MKKLLVVLLIAMWALTAQPVQPTPEQQCRINALAEVDPQYYDWPSIVEMCQP